MSRREEAAYKPSCEFYRDRAMGLCWVATTADGSQRTAQYLDAAMAEQLLKEWLTRTFDENDKRRRSV
jgi:hypothetical protein